MRVTEPEKEKKSWAESGVEVIDVDIDSIAEPKTVGSTAVSWACVRCTFINDCKRSVCEMCDLPNPNQQSDDDDSVTFIPNSTDAGSKKAKMTQHACYINGHLLYDPHPRSIENGGWIWAQNRTSKPRYEDVLGLASSFKAFVASKPKVTRDEVLHLAKQYNVTCGKWLLYVQIEDAAETWRRVRDAVFNGSLGEVAKISKATNNGTFVVCIYCRDFGDRDDVSWLNNFLLVSFRLYSKQRLLLFFA